MSTKIQHYKEKHSLTKNQQIKYILRSNAIAIFLIVSFLFLAVLIGPSILSGEIFQLNPCQIRINELNQYISENGFTIDKTEELNSLAKECGIRLILNKGAKIEP